MLTRFIILLSNPKSAPEIKELAVAMVKSKQDSAHSIQLFLQNVRNKTTQDRLLWLSMH